jgi:5'-nucleotidase
MYFGIRPASVLIDTPAPFGYFFIMLILLSNDDGIQSEGLHALEEALTGLGRIWTVAPSQGMSAVGRALTLHRPLRATAVAERRIMVDGTPSDCINLAVNSLLPEKPGLVVSGINKGANMADDIPYSGTVAAAFEATIWGIPAIAVSLACRKNFHFGPAAQFASRVAAAVLRHGLPPDTFLNINIPDTQGGAIAGYRFTHQGKSIYEGSIEKRMNPRGELYYWIGGDGDRHHAIPGSDTEAVSEACASITPIQTDLTNYKALEILRSWPI